MNSCCNTLSCLSWLSADAALSPSQPSSCSRQQALVFLLRLVPAREPVSVPPPAPWPEPVPGPQPEPALSVDPKPTCEQSRQLYKLQHRGSGARLFVCPAFLHSSPVWTERTSWFLCLDFCGLRTVACFRP